MSDIGHEETEKLLKRLERKVRSIYRQAEGEMKQKLTDFMAQYKAEDKKKRAEMKAGSLSEDDYKKWKIDQILLSEQYKDMRDVLAQDYLKANEIARGLAHDTAIDVYALNHNYGTYIAEKQLRLDTSYTLYDRSTVERLIKKSPKMLPDPSARTLDRIRKKKIVRWNKQKIDSAITQGILQGDPLLKVADRLRQVTDMTEAASRRNARTMITSAQSAGRYDSYRRMKDIGLKPKVVWIATLDTYTRPEHRMLDGQMQDIDEPFYVDGIKILYPGDMTGEYKVPADMLYNCRCTIGVAFPGSKIAEEGLEGVARFSRLDEISYEEWKAGKNE